MTEELLASLKDTKQLSMRCRAGRCSFWIDWQGNMCSCGMYSEKGYSLKDSSFKERWEKIKKDTVEQIYEPFCSACPNYSICNSCIAMVYNESGKRNGRPEYLCEMNEAAAEYYREFLRKIDEKEERS